MSAACGCRRCWITNSICSCNALTNLSASAARFSPLPNTVTTKHIAKPGEEGGHGWLGVKFQNVPRAEPSTIIIHVRMLDWETSRQQEAIGILGVNLIHGAFYQHLEPERLIGSLLDSLSMAAGRSGHDQILRSGV